MTKDKPERRENLKLGLLGGTFDPVHIGHLILAREAQEALDLNRVLFLPALIPPHKDPGGVSEVEHRVEMLRLALENEPDFEPDLREINRGGKSYTLDTLKAVRRDHGIDTEVYFLIGADSLPELRTWHRAQELFSLAHFVTAVRPGFPPERLDELRDAFPDEILEDLRNHCIETTPIGVSSTQIRHNVFNDKSIRHMVPDVVWRYISDHGLYRCDCDKRR